MGVSPKAQLSPKIQRKHADKKGNKKTPLDTSCCYYISNKNPSTCSIKIMNQNFRSLIDSGSDLCMVRSDIFNKINKGKNLSLKPSTKVLRNASGKIINVLGTVTINFELGSMTFKQTFYVSDKIKTAIILGRDFICDNNVYLKLGEGTCEINGKVIPLVDLDEITSLVRLAENVQIPPQHLVSCYAKYHSNFDIKPNSDLIVRQVETSFLSDEPGLLVMNSLVKANHRRRIPLTFVNTTQRTFTLNKGNVVASIEPLGEAELHEIVADTYQNGDKVLHESIKQTQTNMATVNEVYTKCLPTNYADQGYIQQQIRMNQERDRKIIDELVDKNSDIFCKDDFDFEQTDIHQAEVDLENDIPIRERPYRMPFAYRTEAKRQLDAMLKARLISPSNSSYAAPIFCVKKKQTESDRAEGRLALRIVTDYRKLNNVTKKFYWPLPQIDDLFASLNGAKYFSTLDFVKGFNQIPLRKEDRHKTAFVCEQGLFEYNVLSFGLCGAPSIFSQMMAKLLNGASDYAVHYLDDILVFGRGTIEEYVMQLQDVFDRIRKAKLKLQKSKCKFLQPEIVYLGHTISAKGITPDQEKVKVIQELEAPSTVKGVRALIGMCGFYRRFIPRFAHIAEPLTQLTRKHAHFVWNKERQKSFEKLKEALTHAPILTIPRFDLPFKLFTDCSDVALGAVLVQTIHGVDKPVYYLSHQLSKTQRKWSIIERECFAIVFALEKFRVYLEGRPFEIYTDHNPLKFIDSAQNKNAKLQRWAVKISAFGGKIKYIKGSENIQADFLSRIEGNIPRYHDSDKIEESCEINVINSDRLRPLDRQYSDSENDISPEPPMLDPRWNIIQQQNKDRKIQDIKHNLKEKGSKSKFFKRYIIIDEILYYIDQHENLLIEIPKSLQQALIRDTHESSLQHLGRDRCHELLRKKCHFKGLTTMVYAFVEGCIPCQQNKLPIVQTPLQEIRPPRMCFQEIGIDLTGPYIETDNGNRYVLTVVDRLSGYLEAFPINNKQTDTVAHYLINHIFNRYSWPLKIISDRGSEFCSEVIKQITKLGHIHHIQTSPHHARSNGKTERPHRNLVACLSKIKNKQDWDSYISSFCSAMNMSKAASHKHSPFFVLYHREPILPVDSILKPRDTYYGDDYLPKALENMHKAYYLVRKRLQQQGKKNKEYFDKKNNVQDIQFEVGNAVFLLNHQKKDKLDPKWLPFYRILTKTGKYSYVIQHQVTGKTRKAHAKDLHLASSESQWEQLPENYHRRQARLATHDLSSVSDLSSESDMESVDSEIESEDDSEVDNDSTEPGNPMANETNQKETSSEDENVTQNAKPERPQRKAKLAALDKMKHVTEVTSSPSTADVEQLVQQQLNSTLNKFMQSFTNAFQTSIPQS